jgi:hypothetical protein
MKTIVAARRKTPRALDHTALVFDAPRASSIRLACLRRALHVFGAL